MNDETYEKMSDLLEQLSSRQITRSEFDRRKEELLLKDRRRQAAEEGVAAQPGEARRRGVQDAYGRPLGAGGPDGRAANIPPKNRYVTIIVVVIIAFIGMEILADRRGGDSGQTPLVVTEIPEGGVADEMLRAGYTAEQAERIRWTLSLVGITDAELDHMSATPQAEINTVFCRPNGLTEEEDQIFFTTLSGEINYIAHQDTILYDASGNGFISAYARRK
jgi:hypothetical protein